MYINKKQIFIYRKLYQLIVVDDLIQTFLEEFEGAKEELSKGRHKNATILFSKALFAICDILIQSKLNKLPKNHSERFRILEQYFKEVYGIVDDILTNTQTLIQSLY